MQHDAKEQHEGAPPQGGRCGPSPRRQPGHAQTVGPGRQDPLCSGRVEPPDGPDRGGRATPWRSTDRRHGNALLRSQPDRRDREGGQGRRGDGPGRDRGGTVPAGGGDHPRCRRGTAARPRRVGGGDDQGNLRDGVARGGHAVRRNTLSLLLVAGLTVAACGTSSPSPGSNPAKLTVLAAASLTRVFPQIGVLFSRAHPGVKFNFSFGGTDQVAAQIQQGAPADVFAGASTKYGDQLAAANLIDPYRKFCTNQLVLILPSSNPAA